MNEELIEMSDTLELWKQREKIAIQSLSVPEQYAFLKFVEGISEGEKTRNMLAAVNLKWTEFVGLYLKDKRLYLIYEEARKRAELLRQMLREDEADRRAIEGTLKPQFHKGEICGYIREYSDSLLALQLKAGNPQRYQERTKVEHEGVMLNLQVEGIERDPIEPAKDITNDIEEE